MVVLEVEEAILLTEVLEQQDKVTTEDQDILAAVKSTEEVEVELAKLAKMHLLQLLQEMEETVNNLR